MQQLLSKALGMKRHRMERDMSLCAKLTIRDTRLQSLTAAAAAAAAEAESPIPAAITVGRFFFQLACFSSSLLKEIKGENICRTLPNIMPK